jgi:Polyketide cyclase / dehydrase and lipid transport
MYPFDFTHPVIGKASIEIPKPVNDVFAFVGEQFFKNYPRWAQDVSEFEPLTGENTHVGAKARQTRSDNGQVVESVFEISEFVPPNKMTLNGVEQAYRNTYSFVERDDDRHTQLEFSFELLELEFFMRPFEKLIRMAIEEGAETTVANIKNLLCN